MTTRCAVVGATGMAGQQFLSCLSRHPFIEVTRLAASSRSAGKKYIEAITQSNGQIAWYFEEEALKRFAQMDVVEGTEMSLEDVDIVFSAVESAPARKLEAIFAEKLPVISTASAYRYEDDVPIIIPAVNGNHAELLHAQQKKRGWKGFVVPIPNCTTTGLAIAIAPLHKSFIIDRIVLTSMQATSGAGRSPGVIAMDVVDNVIPFIKSEEEKVERETRKLLGMLGDESIIQAEFPVSATCTRVPVLEAHTEAVTVSLKSQASLDEIHNVWESFGREINPNTHPSAPKDWITIHHDPFRPQPRRDRDCDNGMTTSVGRLREDHVLGKHSVKFVLVSHNTKMGAALGAVLVAEDLQKRGFIP